MTKRINMRPVEGAAQHRRSLWPLIIFGAAAGATWSWVDPDGSSHAATESLQLVHALAEQGFDIISENMKLLLANNSI